MSEARGGKARLLTLLPLLAFLALAGLFLVQLKQGGATNTLPSALLGRQVPAFSLPPLRDGQPALTDAVLRDGKVSVVNIFASWCGPCHEEHPFLMELAKDKRIRMIGLNYKDVAENARRFLGAKGDPYALIGVDATGRTAIDWGGYGVPETFIVKGDGSIAFKLVGQITAENLAGVIKPEIEKALKP